MEVVVPSRLGGARLDRLAAALEEQGVQRSAIRVVRDGRDAPWSPSAAFPEPEGPHRRSGFAGASHWGLSRAHGRQAVLLNDDLVPAPGFVEAVAEGLAGAPFVSCRVLDKGGVAVEFDGGGMNALGYALSLGHGSRPSEAAPREVLFGSGAALGLDLDAYRAVGGLATGLFAYFEDMELGWRARRLGYKTVHHPGAAVRHEGQATSASEPGLRERLCERNSLLALLVNAPDEALPRLLALAWRFSSERESLARARGWEARAEGCRLGREGFLEALGRVLDLRRAFPPAPDALSIARPLLSGAENPAFPAAVGAETLAAAAVLWE